MLAAVLDERGQTQEQLEMALADRDVLLKEIHHRVKNNLNVVASLLNLQAGYVRDEHDAALLEEARGRVVAMSRIHERLTRSSMQTSINFGDYLESLVEEFRQSLHRDDIQIEARVEPAVIDIDRAISCGLIVNELATNSLTHAFPQGRSGTITIGFTAQAHGTLRMTVRDDGIGIPPGTDIEGGSSMGMMVVNSLVHQLDGTMSVHIDGGTEFTIDVPAHPPRKSRTA
jgi:two-component sensor histidine kinase